MCEARQIQKQEQALACLLRKANVRICDEEPGALFIETEAAGGGFTVTVEQLRKRQETLQVKKHLSEGNVMNETLKVSNNSHKNAAFIL